MRIGKDGFDIIWCKYFSDRIEAEKFFSECATSDTIVTTEYYEVNIFYPILLILPYFRLTVYCRTVFGLYHYYTREWISKICLKAMI